MIKLHSSQSKFTYVPNPFFGLPGVDATLNNNSVSKSQVKIVLCATASLRISLPQSHCMLSPVFTHPIGLGCS